MSRKKWQVFCSIDERRLSDAIALFADDRGWWDTLLPPVGAVLDVFPQMRGERFL